MSIYNRGMGMLSGFGGAEAGMPDQVAAPGTGIEPVNWGAVAINEDAKRKQGPSGATTAMQGVSTLAQLGMAAYGSGAFKGAAPAVAQPGQTTAGGAMSELAGPLKPGLPAQMPRAEPSFMDRFLRRADAYGELPQEPSMFHLGSVW